MRTTLPSESERLEQAAQRILSGELPIPTEIRWQPLRAGLMNLFCSRMSGFRFPADDCYFVEPTERAKVVSLP